MEMRVANPDPKLVSSLGGEGYDTPKPQTSLGFGRGREEGNYPPSPPPPPSQTSNLFWGLGGGEVVTASQTQPPYPLKPVSAAAWTTCICANRENTWWSEGEFRRSVNRSPQLSWKGPKDWTHASQLAGTVFLSLSKDPNCVICKLTKTARAPYRNRLEARGDRIHLQQKLGDAMTADGEVLKEENESRLQHRHTVLVQDRYSYWIHWSPYEEQNCHSCR